VKRVVAPVVVAVLPIVVAVARALHHGWRPVGDNAYFAIRARDVLTEHHPLVGAWSSGSAVVGVEVNNLGPLQLDLLALPVRALGSGAGTALGVAALNVAAVVMVVVLAERRLGPLGAWLGAAMATGLAWTLGSELLFEPRQHHALVLPFLAVLTAAWAVAAGERWALPALVLMASVVAQTHLTFVVPVLAVAAVAVAGVAATRRARRWRSPVLVAAGVALACWAQPLAEELRAGEGNLSAAAEAAGRETDSYGLAAAVRATVEVLAPPGGWWRGSFRSFDPAGAQPSTAAAVAVLLLTAAAMAVLGYLAHRRGDRAVTTWLATAAVAVAAGLVAASSSPADGPFGVVSGNFRYLWPTAVFVTFGIVAAAVRAMSPRAARVATPTVASAAVAMAIAALPTSYQSPGPEADAPLIPVARDVAAQVAGADVEGPVVVDRSGLFFGEPYSYVVVDALQGDGVDLVFEEPTDLARFGSGRARSGPVAGTVSLAVGDAALAPRPGAELLARASRLGADERAELDRLRTLPEPDEEETARRDELEDLARRGTVAVWLSPSR
jgi:hypothetical protein